VARRLALGLLVAHAAGCSSARYGASETGAPSVTFPAHFAEGHTGKDGGPPSEPDAAAASKAPAASSASGSPRKMPPSLPDPEPISTRDQLEFVFDYDRGAVKVRSVRAVTLDRPASTPRKLGRFAVELWIGHELVDRVRFDFPLLAADEAEAPGRRPLHDSPRFGPGAETSQKVVVPRSDRATSAVLVDRLTGATTPLVWPPVLTEEPPPAPSAR